MSNRIHQSAGPGSDVWLTPPAILAALGGAETFDLDPCAAPEPRPWPTARVMNARLDRDGLAIRWFGRVWLNPPYTRGELARWIARLAAHGRGTALIPAAVETLHFRRSVWDAADGVLFPYGRLCFHSGDGSLRDGRVNNSGGPSALVAYGRDDLERLSESGIEGKFLPIRFDRFIVVAAMSGTWSTIVLDWLRRQRGPVRLDDAYRYFARHPKAAANRNVEAKVRQQLARHARRIEPGVYEVAA